MSKFVLGFTAAVLLNFTSPAQTFIVTNGLVAYYQFDGNLNEATGNGNNGMWVGNTNYEPGIVGAALRLDGSSYVQVPDELALNFGAGSNFAISAWVQPQSSSTDYGEMDIVDKRYIPPPHPNVSTAVGYSFFLVNGRVFCQLAQAPGNGISNYGPVGPDLRDGKFHFAAMSVVRNSTTGGNLYVDGEAVVTFDPTAESGDLSSTQPLLIGHNTEINGGFTGGIDELRIYNRALSSNEVAQLYVSTLPPHGASGIAVLVAPFIVGVNLTDNGAGYTNTPLVRFIGGGGSGAQAVAVVSNGLVTAINMISAGAGYTNAAVVVIDPPFISEPVLSVAPVALLTFSNVSSGSSYQLQQFNSTSWINQGNTFTASNAVYTQTVLGIADSGSYRLAIAPVPVQATATAQVVNGFVVGAQVTIAGTGYVTPPTVRIISSVGSNATAVASVSGGRITGITITSAGNGYNSAVTIRIDPPPVTAFFPIVLPGVRLDASSLAPYDNYQLQFKPEISAAWTNWSGALFSPSGSTNSQYIFNTNDAGFFRLRFVP